MVIDVFAIHVLFSEVASLILKNLAVHWQNFRKQADLHLLVELVRRIAIDKNSFSSGVGMKVQKPKVFAFAVKMNDSFLYCVDGAVCLWGGIYVAAV